MWCPSGCGKKIQCIKVRGHGAPPVYGCWVCNRQFIYEGTVPKNSGHFSSMKEGVRELKGKEKVDGMPMNRQLLRW